MNKYKYLLKNVGLLTISEFGSKLLSFILIPLYTSILTTSEYGIYDICSTTLSLITPLLTLDIASAVLRFSLDKNADKGNVFTIGLKNIGKAILIFTIFNCFNKIFDTIPTFSNYALYLEIMYISQLTYSLLTQFARGLEAIKDISIAGIINSITLLSLNILFLVNIKLGLDGYFLANCLAYVVPTIYLAIRLNIKKYVVKVDNELFLKQQMLGYSKPLIFKDMSWWVINASDRYVVTWLCGSAANGIYSVSYKIPSVLNVVQSIFNQAWTISSIKEFENNNSKFYSNIYEIYNCGIVLICSILITADKVIAKILFAESFYSAWEYAPFLMISVVFGSMSGILSGILSAAKESSVMAKSVLIGAITNVVLNILFVLKLGPIGAAIATLICYVIVWCMNLCATKNIVKLSINLKKDLLAYLILIMQAITLVTVNQNIIIYFAEIVMLIILMFLYQKTIWQIINKFKEKIGIKNERIK